MSKFSVGLALVVTLNLALAGCQPTSESSEEPGVSPSAGSDSHDQAHPEDQAHGEEGPHGGHLIELGQSHEYHAELVDDHQAGTITVHILDTNMKPLPIAVGQILLNLNAAGQTTTHELSAAGDCASPSAQFTSADEALLTMLDHEGEVSGTLRVTIDDKPFSGSFAHHAHDDEHAHGDEHGDEHAATEK